MTTMVSTNIHKAFARGCALVRRVAKRIWPEVTGPRMVSMQTLPDEAFLAHFNLEEVTKLLEQGEVSAAKEALLAHYESRVMSAWPLPPSGIPDLYIDTTKLGQEELIARADSYLEHRFVLTPAKAPRLTPEEL